MLFNYLLDWFSRGANLSKYAARDSRDFRDSSWDSRDSSLDYRVSRDSCRDSSDYNEIPIILGILDGIPMRFKGYMASFSSNM